MSNNMDLGTNLEGFIKTLLQRLDMPTKEDINHLHDRLDTLEQLLQQKKTGTKRPPSKRTPKRKSASATVLEIIAAYPDGADIKTIKSVTGFEDKKLRNIIYRLDTLGKIQRVSRGTYKTH
jgi:predicted Rossmann fold nucleotide-binding protein DprA/Smf involved in DNA uptake